MAPTVRIRHKPVLNSLHGVEKLLQVGYKCLKGSRRFNVEEMSRLIDIALKELNDIGLMLPQEERFVKALEEHERIKTENDLQR